MDKNYPFGGDEMGGRKCWGLNPGFVNSKHMFYHRATLLVLEAIFKKPFSLNMFSNKTLLQIHIVIKQCIQAGLTYDPKFSS